MHLRADRGLFAFNPPRDAEPSGSEEQDKADANGEADKPTVLTKLQKWADYPSVGNPVRPTNFLPMKTPMSTEIISSWSLPSPPKNSLTVPELVSVQSEKGRCVGMIIDLANHECLYADDLPGTLEYTHIQLVAKVIPPIAAIQQVAAAATEFWSRRPRDFIAIHCAYGFNRTGFVVCSYLCQICGMSVPEALESFAQARPPGVKHGKFVDELYIRYGGGKYKIYGNIDKQEQELIDNGVIADHQEQGQVNVRISDDASEPPSTLGLLALQLQGSTDFHSNILERRIRDPNNTTKDAITGLGTPSFELGHALFTRKENATDDVDDIDITLSMNTNSDSILLNPNSDNTNNNTSNNWSAMAHHLDGQSKMRRETSMGLAKALHEDFGIHDSTPNRNMTSPLMARADSEAQTQAVADLVDTHTLVDITTGKMQQDEDSSHIHENSSPATEFYDTDNNITSTHNLSDLPVQANLRLLKTLYSASSTSKTVPRNVSVESDNQSLGFSAREVIQEMIRHQGAVPQGSFNRMGSERDSRQWEGDIREETISVPTSDGNNDFGCAKCLGF